MQERWKSVSLGSGTHTREIVLVDSEGLLTKSGKEAHTLVFVHEQLKNRKAKRLTFALSPTYKKNLQRREEELIMSFGISDKRRTQGKQIGRLNETLTDAGYPTHWRNTEQGPARETNMDATVIYTSANMR